MEEKINEFIAKEVKKAGMSGYRLSKETGMSQSHISRIITGENHPSADTFFRICKALNLEITDIEKIYKKYL